MFSVAIELSPWLFGVPQERRRIYIVAVSRHRLAGLTDGQARRKLISLFERLMRSWRLICIDAFKNDECSESVTEQLCLARSLQRDESQVHKHKWFRRHRRLLRKHPAYTSMDSRSLGLFEHVDRDVHPGIAALPRRDREVLQLCRVELPSQKTIVVNTSQKFEMTSVPRDNVNCVTPHGTFFCAKSMRALQGSELLRLQSILFRP